MDPKANVLPTTPQRLTTSMCDEPQHADYSPRNVSNGDWVTHCPEYDSKLYRQQLLARMY